MKVRTPPTKDHSLSKIFIFVRYLWFSLILRRLKADLKAQYIWKGYLYFGRKTLLSSIYFLVEKTVQQKNILAQFLCQFH